MEPTIYKRSEKGRQEESRSLSLRFKDHSMLLSKRFVIGRDPLSDIPLPNDPLVSRVHAMINLVNGQYFIHDMNSTNGTYLNNNPLTRDQKVALALGDVILIGKTTITVVAGVPG